MSGAWGRWGPDDELLDLDRLAADGVHEFLFMGAPLPLAGGTGVPISPLAIG